MPKRKSLIFGGELVYSTCHPSGKYKLSSETWKWDFFWPTLPLTLSAGENNPHKETCPVPKWNGTELGDSTLKNKWESETKAQKLEIKVQKPCQ